MNFLVGFGIFALVKLLKYYITSDTEVKPVYVSNDNQGNKSILQQSYDILGLEYDQPISIETINHAFNEQLKLASEGFAKGYEPTYSLDDIKAAKAYLLDFCDYMGAQN